MPTIWNAVKHTYTSFLAISWSRLGRRLILWLIARLRMCLGRVWKTRELEDFCETAFNMALISAARAWAKADAGMKRTASEHDKQPKNQRRILDVNYRITPSTAAQYLLDMKVSIVHCHWRNFNSLDILKFTDMVKQIFIHEWIWKLFNQQFLFALNTSLLN